MTWLDPAHVAAYLAAGAALGATYFFLLFQTVRLHASRAAAIRIVPLYVLRFAVAVLAFWVIAQQGAAPLVLALLGFLIARVAAQRWAGAE